MIQIHKDLEWLREYILLARPYLSNLDNLVKVTKNPNPTVDRIQRSHAQITKTSKGKYSISLYTHMQTIKKLRPKVITVVPYSKIDILEYLAHELAHMIHLDEHTPQHKRLQCELTIIFMEHLLKSGYISEEKELL